MLKSLLDRLVQSALSNKTRPRKVQSILFGFIVVPVLLVATISFMKTRKDLAKAVLARREAFAALAAATLKERIDRLMDLGLSFAIRPRVRRLVAKGQWKEVDVEGDAFLSITDRRGRVVSHSHLSPHGEDVNFSGVAPVQRALRGERGILISQDPEGTEQQVGACAPIPGSGWAAVVQQPAGTAFAVRNRTLATMAACYGAVVVLSVFLASVILSMIGGLCQVRRCRPAARPVLAGPEGAAAGEGRIAAGMGPPGVGTPRGRGGGMG